MALALGAAPCTAQQSSANDAQEAQGERQFDIPAQPLTSAVTAFGDQAGVQVTVDGSILSGLTSTAVSGSFTPVEALGRLLDGTGITFRWVNSDSIALEQASADTQGAIELGTLRVEGQEARGSGGIGRDGSIGTGGVAGGADEIFAAPRAVSIVTREEIDRTPARHAADLIAEVPGVTSPVNRLNPGLSVNIRGMQDFGRVNMMIDGMRQTFVQNGHQQRNGQMYIDPELISSVVIERGPRNNVHGTGATAGTVNFRTIGPEDVLTEDADRVGVRLRASTGLGSEGNGVNFLGSAAVAGRLTENLDLIAAYSRRDIGDYDIGTKGEQFFYPSVQGADGTELVSQIKYASQLQESALAKARLTLGDHQLELSYIGTWIDYDNVGDVFGASTEEEETFWNRLGHSHVAAESFAFDYNWNPESNWVDFRLKFYHVNTRSRNYSEARYPEGLEGYVDLAWSLGSGPIKGIPKSVGM